MSTDTLKSLAAQPIHHIQHSVPFKLDMEISKYASWCELFKIHCRAHDVFDHLTSDSPATSSKGKETDDSNNIELWHRQDEIVLQWIYATISIDVMHTILEPDTTAKQAWERLKNIFHDNKNSRALALENQFLNTKLDNFPNVSAYCQELKMLSDQLANVDAKVDRKRLVLQLVAGLNDNYAAIGTHINQMKKLPTFYDARSKLILEESLKNRKAAMANPNDSSTALVATTENSDNQQQQNTGRDSNTNNRTFNNGGYCGRGGRNRGGCSYRGRGCNTSHNNNQSGNLLQAWARPPLGPHKTATGTGPIAIISGLDRPNNSAASAGILGPRPQANYASNTSSYTPTDIDQALYTMSLNPPDDKWYMDTGASSYMTGNRGYPTTHRGYKCYNLQTRTIIISRHVLFNETSFPFDKSQTPQPEQYDVLHSPISILPTNIPQPQMPYQPSPPAQTPITPQTQSPSSGSSTSQSSSSAQRAQSPTLAHSQSPHWAQSLPTAHTESAQSASLPSVTETSNSPPTPPLGPVFHTPPPARTITTRSMSGIFKPKNPFNLSVTANPISPIPKNLKEALNDPNWKCAMTDEFQALIKNGTWDLIFKYKFRSDGTFERYKARLVGDGRSQQVGIDCTEKFSPVVKPVTIRVVISLALANSWAIHQLDVKNAFLHGNLHETVFMHQPMAYVSTLGFVHSRCDHSLFIYRNGYDIAYLLLYVDDIILTASSDTLRRTIIHNLSGEFAMKDLGSIQTPVDTKPKQSGKTGKLYSDRTEFCSLAGALQYLTFTRPDISYAGTVHYGLHLYRLRTQHLVSYTDADWAGCPDTRRSTLGYCVYFGDNLISWSSKRQATLSRSSAEAEYRGVANVVSESCWLRNLLLELHRPVHKATVVYCDNVSTVFMSSNPIQHQRTKHIELDIHFVRDQVARGQVRVLHVPSRYQIADVFTKGLPLVLFDEFRDILHVRLPPASTAGDY
ncbi:uncharacterized protein [Rutidosis leptorrhynchoides]|uniref:uncharacterized protein n=1 Tax=Rutidosis leptorrhynchoides TaxID=125765 RepID=UPI003A993172